MKKPSFYAPLQACSIGSEPAIRQWQLGMTCNYHARPNGPISKRRCVITESPFHVPAFGMWYVTLDKVKGIVPITQISHPGRATQTLSMIPELMKRGYLPPKTRQIPGAKPIPERITPATAQNAGRSAGDPE